MVNISISQFTREARRRRVFQTAAIYIVATWVILQVAALASPGLDIPDSAIRYVWIGAFLGFPIALLSCLRKQVRLASLDRAQESIWWCSRTDARSFTI